MPQYLVANYLPDDFDPSTVTEAMIEQIHALNREMIAAGVRKFACGISSAGSAKTLRARPDGKVLVTDGPYTETKEHMGGFWILECADIDEALAWAKKGAIACDVPGEVRELLFYPAPEQEPGEKPVTPGHCHFGICLRLDDGRKHPTDETQSAGAPQPAGADAYTAGSHPEGKGEEP